MAAQPTTDFELWEAIRLDDERAFAMFFKRYWLRLYKTAHYFSKDENTSKDLVHNVFLVLWEKRKTLQIDDFSAYLNAATRYEVFKFLKKRNSSLLTYVDELPADLPGDVQNEAIFTMARADLEARLNLHLKSLPKRCADIFRMSKIQQLKNEEIAERLGIAKHSVENQLSYALKHIQKHLSDLPLILIVLKAFDL